MSVRPVVQLPHSVLTKPTRLVDAADEVSSLADDLVDTMRASPACVGIAANQIGVDLRAFAIDVTGHPKTKICHGLIVLFNPVLISAEDPKKGREGCMSIPDLTGDVVRAQRVAVAGTDRFGDLVTIESDAFEARALLHELDHLDGHVFLDRVAGPTAIFRRQVYK